MTDDALSPEMEEVYNYSIEKAENEGNTERARRLYQQQQGVDPDNPYATDFERELAELVDSPAENAEVESDTPEASDIEDMGGNGIADVEPLDVDLVEPVLAVFSEFEADAVAGLREEWPGGEMAANLGYYKFMLDEYVPEYLHGEMPDSVGTLRVGAAVGREIFHRYHANNNPEIMKGNQMTENNEDEIRSIIRDLDEAIDEAQASGNNAEMQEAYLLQQEMYRKLPGGGDPIVDGVRTT